MVSTDNLDVTAVNRAHTRGNGSSSRFSSTCSRNVVCRFLNQHFVSKPLACSSLTKSKPSALLPSSPITRVYGENKHNTAEPPGVHMLRQQSNPPPAFSTMLHPFPANPQPPIASQTCWTSRRPPVDMGQTHAPFSATISWCNKPSATRAVLSLGFAVSCTCRSIYVTSTTLTLCSRAALSRPGQLGFSWRKTLLLHPRPMKQNPILKNRRFGHGRL